MSNGPVPGLGGGQIHPQHLGEGPLHQRQVDGLRDEAQDEEERIALPDVAALLAEDEAASDKARPFRFGQGLEVAIGVEQGGEWLELADGRRLWRVRVESPGAYSLNLVFDRFQLSEGAELYVYNDLGSVRGAFTAEFNQPHGLFATEPLAGDALTIEYVEPQEGALGALRLSEVIHAYRDILAPEPDG